MAPARAAWRRLMWTSLCAVLVGAGGDHLEVWPVSGAAAGSHSVTVVGVRHLPRERKKCSWTARAWQGVGVGVGDGVGISASSAGAQRVHVRVRQY